LRTLSPVIVEALSAVGCMGGSFVWRLGRWVSILRR
jgi:hypothetical protein